MRIKSGSWPLTSTKIFSPLSPSVETSLFDVTWKDYHKSLSWEWKVRCLKSVENEVKIKYQWNRNETRMNKVENCELKFNTEKKADYSVCKVNWGKVKKTTSHLPTSPCFSWWLLLNRNLLMSDSDELSGLRGKKRISKDEMGRKLQECSRDKWRSPSFTHDWLQPF